MDGSNCSALKGSGSNQDPKRTNGSSKSAFDSSTGHVTPFQESLHSTIREQEASRERPRAADNTSRKSESARPGNQPQKLNAAYNGQRRTTEKTKPDASAKSDEAGQPQAPNTTANASGVDPALASAVLGNVQPLNNVPVNLASDSAVAAINGDSTPQAINNVAAANQVELASETKPAADADALVFDASLHSAAPVPARPPQAALAGAGKPTWLLNSQLYAARQDSDQAANTNHVPPPDTANKSQAETAESVTPQQTSIQNIAAVSVPADKSGASNSQTKPDANPVQTNHAQTITPHSAGQTNMEQSSSDNTPGFEKDPKQQLAAENAPNHQPEPAAQSSHVIQTSAAAPTKVDTAAPSNNAVPVSSKSSVLPINQQAEIHQPSMKTDLNMRIQGQSGESINLRISERAGDIQISVRSSDQGTANVLKHELPSIEAGLERAGWRMETGGMSQSGQDQHEAGRDSQNPDRNRDQNSQQQSNWQDRNQRRRDSSPNPWFEMDQ
jgi:hypothetical protein